MLQWCSPASVLKLCVLPTRSYDSHKTQRSFPQNNINQLIIMFFTKLIQKFFILIHLLHTSTCFEHYYAHPQEVKFVLVQNLVSSLSLGYCSVHRLRKDCVLNSHLKTVTIPDAVLIQNFTSWGWAQ